MNQKMAGRKNYPAKRCAWPCAGLLDEPDKPADPNSLRHSSNLLIDTARQALMMRAANNFRPARVAPLPQTPTLEPPPSVLPLAWTP